MDVKPHKKESGFTLVELAVVMIIIGLLIGGVLKGQELIQNAQISSTASQIRNFDAALVTFRDMFGAVPGDLPNPGARLPDCTTTVCLASGGGAVKGNGRLETAFDTAPGPEAHGFFVQLAKADLIGGINEGSDTFGGNFPNTDISGMGLEAAYTGGTALGDLPALNAAVTTSVLKPGHYLALTATANAATGTGTVGMTPSVAARLDRKMDDGSAGTGSMYSFESGAGDCSDANGVYQEATQSNVCGLYIRMQQI